MSGQIIFTTDPAWGGEIIEVETSSQNTCGSPITTITQGSLSLFRNYCDLPESPKECTAPNGLFKLRINSISFNRITINLLIDENDDSGRLIYDGPVNRSAGIHWSPQNDRFFFMVDNTLILADLNGNQIHQSPLSHPSFSPDGRYILYLKPVGPGIHDIFIYNINSDVEQNLTENPDIDKVCPAWNLSQ